ncbi:MAG TPA: UDP-glucose/GDP-mannose dehydrogenase family protein [Methanospirillum sp.]|uniref:UDP-glucose dehydrogenase family protein n=1 Tax=Methanospirillum sp. TaxID=45200 RepID=UPI002C5527DC|nr:UDP-glucose/GDP-mannose dehydrogenase family protein [Methanospirillum sp.]HOJ97537.1 UDP-glucose/GDP-mannose dehydrogenase family protein [Methanospirillum sp.]
MNITVIGGGYVGLVTASCFAYLGHTVRIVEIDTGKADLINQGVPPIYEDKLEEILRQISGKNLSAQSHYEGIEDADIILICVGTPPQDDGSADLRYITGASESIGYALKGSTKYHVITVKSTVPPGTTESVVIPAVMKPLGDISDTVGFCMNPEFLREGRAIDDFLHPDRIVIGGTSQKAIEVVQKAYEKLDAPVITTSLKAAEMIKYTSNAFLATKISFSNEIGNICKKLGIDVYEVMKGVGYDHRINPYFLNAGLGFGGSCFPKDVMALIRLAERYGEEPVLLKSVIEVNEQQPGRIIQLLRTRIGDLKEKKIAVLGLAFKDNTDDVRDSRSIPVISELLEQGAIISAFDPMAADSMKKIFPSLSYYTNAGDALEGADACLVLTEWPEFSKLGSEFARMKNQVIIEGRKILSRSGIEGVCW